VESTEKNRSGYRELLFTAPGIEDFISGVILFDETLHQSSRNGLIFTKILQNRGIIPGIKEDKGLTIIPMTDGEKSTQDLDGLAERLSEYHALGARFSKWRSVIQINEHMLSRFSLFVNAHGLAQFAAISQQAGLVPIIEPEILINGPHSIDASIRAH
jgi:fructose-bisphosphate aldolase, class I